MLVNAKRIPSIHFLVITFGFGKYIVQPYHRTTLNHLFTQIINQRIPQKTSKGFGWSDATTRQPAYTSTKAGTQVVGGRATA
jgi:hypothetical protein